MSLEDVPEEVVVENQIDVGRLLHVYDVDTGKYLTDVYEPSLDSVIAYYRVMNIRAAATPTVMHVMKTGAVYDPTSDTWTADELISALYRSGFEYTFSASDWEQYLDMYYISIPGRLHNCGKFPVVIVDEEEEAGVYVRMTDDKYMLKIVEVDRVLILIQSTTPPFNGRLAIR